MKKYGKIFPKDLSEFNLAILFAEDQTDSSRIFQGVIDFNSFHIVLERLTECQQEVEEILLIR